MEHNDTLTKLYVEITTRCNLDCAMCVRRAWREPMGEMPLAVFAELMDQVRELTEPLIIHLSGYGEPTCHPDFLEMVALAKATGARVEMTTNGTLLTRQLIAALIDLDGWWCPSTAPRRPAMPISGSTPATTRCWPTCWS